MKIRCVFVKNFKDKDTLCQALEQAARESGWDTIPGGV